MLREKPCPVKSPFRGGILSLVFRFSASFRKKQCKSLQINIDGSAISYNLNTFYIQGLCLYPLIKEDWLMRLFFSKQALIILCALAISGSAADCFAKNISVKTLPASGGVQAIQAETLIDAPVHTVWNNLVDYGNMKNILPGYERSTVLQASGATKTVDLQVKASGLLPSFRYQVKIREDKASNTIDIQRISGDFKTIAASYKLVPTGNHNQTRLIYTLNIELGDKVPSLGAGHLLKGNTEKAMLALQSHCNRAYQRSVTAQAHP
jgi:carbon monoxide dehydrogenase subunit G